MSSVKLAPAYASGSPVARVGQIADKTDADKTDIAHDHATHHFFQGENRMGSGKTRNVNIGIGAGRKALYLPGTGVPAGEKASDSCFLVRNGGYLRSTEGRRNLKNGHRQRQDLVGPAGDDSSSSSAFIGRQKEFR